MLYLFTKVVNELFIRIISLIFITESYFAMRKNVRRKSAHDFFMKIPNKWELQQIAFNYSSDIYFMNLYKKCRKLYPL